ncbi:MAG TPA: S41 family peptidase [Candidatus Methylomirabilis sp.]|nr:S41 family peptidase [Candidatus Methylomirabilis sp.]
MPFLSAQTKRNTPPHLVASVIAVAAFLGGLALGYDQGLASRGLSWGVRNGNVASGATSTRPNVIVTGIGGKTPSGVTKKVDFSLFWDMWNDLKDQYYEQPVDDQILFYGAMRGMAAALGDPYTVYFEPKDAEEFTQALKGEFSGIGAEIGSKNGQLQIITPLADSPAERAGIKPRDFILKIDDEDSISMPVDLAVTKIRGPKGTDVKLELGRAKPQKDSKAKPEYETIELTITRDTIVVKSVRVKPQKDGFFLIEIHNFNADVEESFRAAVDDVIEKGAKGIVIDVRNDPGGYLDKAIAVAGEWVNDDIVVEQRERGEITEQYKGVGRGLLKRMPTVVLVNEGSASAAEILAGALQDYGIAAIVGKKTFGKGSVQDYREYPDGSAVKITIAEWLTPKGRNINKEGIIPDVEAELTPEDIDAERDPQLDKALELLRTGKATPAKPAITKP